MNPIDLIDLSDGSTLSFWECGDGSIKPLKEGDRGRIVLAFRREAPRSIR
jgi:hypothetical protein